MKDKEQRRFEAEVFAREAHRIDARRGAASLRRLGPLPPAPTTKLGLVGLALSGGGIRSSTFSLGVIQALARRRVFDKIDYLSTVSGGGYIGACLTSLLNDKALPPGSFPLADHDGQQVAPTVAHLRSNADYLSPGGTAGRLRIVAMVLRGMVLNLLLVLQAILFATSLTACLYWGTTYVTDRIAIARCESPGAYDAAIGELARWAERRSAPAAVAASLALLCGFLFAARRRRAAQVQADGSAQDGQTRAWASRERRERRTTAILIVAIALGLAGPLYALVSYAFNTPWETRHGLKAMWWNTVLGRSQLGLWCAGAVALITALSALRTRVGKLARRFALLCIGVLGPAAPVILYLLLCMRLIESTRLDPDLMAGLLTCAEDNVLGCGDRLPNLAEWARVLDANALDPEERRWSVRQDGATGAWTANIEGTDAPLMILEPLPVVDLRAALSARGIEVEGQRFDVTRERRGWVIEVNGRASPPFESLDLSDRLRRVMLMRELQRALNDKGLNLKEGHWKVIESSGFRFRGESWVGEGPAGTQCLLGDGGSAPVWIVSTREAAGTREYPLLFEQPRRISAALAAILDGCRARAEGGSPGDDCTDASGVVRVAPNLAEELRVALDEDGLSIKEEIVGVRLASGLSWVVQTDEGQLFPVVPDRGHLEVRNLGVAVGLGHGRNGIVVSLLLWLASVLIFRVIDVNKASLCGFYRDRLSRLFLIRVDPRTNDIVHCDEQKLSKLPEDTAAPYHLINATLNLQVNKGHRLHSRQADFFFFSPCFVGSEHTGYCATADMEKEDDHVDLGTAMAISAAAAAPNMGTLTIRPLVFIMTLLNLRLAYWVPNPREVGARAAEDRQSAGGASARRWLRDWLTAIHVRRPGLRYFIREALGKLDTDGPYVNVSDGGHLENTGIYQLLRRRCKLIIAVDGEADPGMEFTSLLSMMRYARIDLGVQFEEVQLDPIRKVDGWSKNHWMLARIRYSAAPGEEPEIGHLLYIKSSMTGDEPEYLRAYKQFAPAFPHESTADQFFNETQFEAYRALGEHVGDIALRESRIADTLLGEIEARDSLDDVADSITQLSLSIAERTSATDLGTAGA